MAVRGLRPSRHYTDLDEQEKAEIIRLWHEYHGPGAISIAINSRVGAPGTIRTSTVQSFLLRNGFRRSRQEQLDGARKMREQVR
jgi:hypothetical protein